MRDRNPFRDEPGNWSDAFNRIPMESPERDAWSRLALEIHPPARPAARIFRWAAAAIVALAIALPLARLARDAGTPETPLLAAQAPMPLATPEPANVMPVDAVEETPAIFDKAPLPPEQRQVSIAGAVDRDTTRRPATAVTASAANHPDTGAEPISIVDATAIGQDSLPDLYAESAQLEALLTEMQDARVSSGPAAALAAQYESRLATIDASLSDPALPDDSRTTLWNQRVDALRELVGFEATQRWLNARGERYDGQLLAVY